MATPLVASPGFELEPPASGQFKPSPGFELQEPAAQSGFTASPGFELEMPPSMGERLTAGAKTAATEVGGWLNSASGAMGEGQMAAPQPSPEPKVSALDQVAAGLEPIISGAKRGFGEQPLGIDPEKALAAPGLYTQLQPFVAPIDFALRAPGAVVGGVSALAGQMYRGLGANENEAARLERDLFTMGQSALLEGGMGGHRPVGMPKAVERPLTPAEFIARIPVDSPAVADFQRRALTEFGGYSPEDIAAMSPIARQAAYKEWAAGSSVVRPQTGPQLALPAPGGGLPPAEPPAAVVPPTPLGPQPIVPSAGPRQPPGGVDVASVGAALRGEVPRVSPFDVARGPEPPAAIGPLDYSGAVPPEAVTPTVFPPGEPQRAQTEMHPDVVAALHASTHDFDTFDISKAGTGEGPQGSGYGIYLTEGKGTHDYYLEHLGRDKPAISYEVQVLADKEHFLDLDKPLREQSAFVRSALQKLPGVVTQYNDNPTGRDIFENLYLQQSGQVGEANPFRRPEWEKRTSDKLQGVGIPGTKTLGEAADGHNLVVFDTKKLRIINKSGGIEPLREETTSLASPGANIGRLSLLMGANLYGRPENIAEVSIKEMLQNSFDAMKGLVSSGKIAQGQIHINVDPVTRQLSIYDNGAGMTPEVMGGAFLRIAGTHKETTQASGGFGIAKMLYLFGNQKLAVISLRDGKVHSMVTSGPELLASANDPANNELRPKIVSRLAGPKEAQMFPEGHGTMVAVVVPESYRDPSTGEMAQIPFDPYSLQRSDALTKSPLFHNIDVKFNGQSVPNAGAAFDHTQYTSFANVNFDWGTARVYVSKNPRDIYHGNAHILSNGLWQFDINIRKDPNSSWGENVSREFYIDVKPTVRPEDSGYPFDLNRQGFAKAIGKDFDKIFKYMSILYRQEEAQSDVVNYGNIQYVARDDKGVFASEKFKIAPKIPPKETAVTLIRPGDQIEVHDGKLVVNGRRIPELTPADLDALKTVDVNSLIVPQEEINPNVVILHDNIDVLISDLETRSLVDLAREIYGEDFDTFVHDMGTAFLNLRDVVAETLGYPELRKEGIGISFDEQYRGVSIRVPFAASFLNVAVPEYTDPVRAAIGMVGTMVHELAHHQVRGHDADFPAEMQRILISLDAHPTFNFQAFKQKVVNTVSRYNNVFQYLNGVLTSGTFPIQPRGKRLKDAGSDEARDGGGLGDVGAPGVRRGGEPGVREGTPLGASTPGGQPGRTGVPLTVSTTQTDRSAGRNANQRALNADAAGIPAVPRQPEVEGVSRNIETLFQAVSGGPPKHVQTFAAHADRMNRFYKYAAGLDQLIKGNPTFTPLLQYGERIRQMHNEEARIHDTALRIGKRWRSLGTRGDNLSQLFDDMANMRYLTSAEVRVNTVRHPTNAELDTILKTNKIDQETLGVFNDVRAMFDGFLTLVEGNAIQAAQRIITSDPRALADKIDQIRAQITEMRAKPYFPFLRFGRHFVMKKNAAGRIVNFQTFERRGLVSAESQQKNVFNEATRGKAIDEVVTFGLLPENSAPFAGMPPALLNLIKTELHLTPDQITALEQIQLQQSPALSFKRLMKSNYTPGYSMDFKRAFARYFFHGGKYHARTKFGFALRGDIAAARATPNDNKAHLIADYMQDHLDNTILDAKGDFGIFKGAIFLWAMGYVPAAAAQNLSQTPMITLPFLAAKFGPPGLGDARAAKALVKAMGNVNNFYKKGAYDKMTNFEGKALAYGIKTGRISETQAPELAGMSVQGNLFHGIAGNTLQRGTVNFQEKAAWMFEMAEQYNRRVAWRAALDLAMAHPAAKGVKDALNVYSNEYHALQMVNGGQFTPQEAAAIVTAAHAVDSTQFVYARYARPRMFRGRISGTLFVFKKYMQSVLFLLGQNKADVLPRYLLIAAFLGGMAGLPGYDDFRDILRALAYHLFGKDFNLDRKVREWVTQHTDGTIPPDIVLHGLARMGFGLPALVDMMGSKPGRGLSSGMPGQNVPFPVLDRSRALSMGNILPFEVGKLMSPQKDVNATIAEQTQKASGAVFSVGFNAYKALQNQGDEEGMKRWEHAMPRALSSASRSYRAFTEGRERGKGGPNSAPTIVPFDTRDTRDTRDTEQMMEALAMAAGYQPLRVQAKWDSILAKVEVQKFYDMRREALLHQMFEATSGKIPQEIDAVRKDIIKYNQELPAFAKGKAILPETLQTSIEARQRSRISKEIGTPAQATNVGISRYVDTLFPETTVDVRRVR